MDYNHVTIVGRLAGNPQLKGFKKSDGSDGMRCFMRIAVTRLGDLGAKREDRRTNFVPVVCWGKLAKRCAEYLAKGTEVTVAGELIAESEKLEGTEGYKEYIHVQATAVQFGRRSMKNATPEQRQAAIDALKERVDGAAEGTGSQAPIAAPIAGTNPFEETAA